MLINIHHFILNKNVRIASQWFEIGSMAKWSRLKETREQEKLDRLALQYQQEQQYEIGLITV